MVDVRGGGRILLIDKYIVEEDLSSQIDGINKIFNISNVYVSGKLKTFLNGLRQYKGVNNDFVELGTNQIEFTDPPDIDDILIVDYIKK